MHVQVVSIWQQNNVSRNEIIHECCYNIGFAVILYGWKIISSWQLTYASVAWYMGLALVHGYGPSYIFYEGLKGLMDLLGDECHWKHCKSHQGRRKASASVFTQVQLSIWTIGECSHGITPYGSHCNIFLLQNLHLFGSDSRGLRSHRLEFGSPLDGACRIGVKVKVTCYQVCPGQILCMVSVVVWLNDIRSRPWHIANACSHHLCHTMNRKAIYCAF